MVRVEQTNEIVAKLRELETEHNLMKNLLNRALRTSQSGSDVKLNFRQGERHMPGMFKGKATEDTEYMFKMEAYLSTLHPGGKGGEVLRAAATEAKDIADLDDSGDDNEASSGYRIFQTRRSAFHPTLAGHTNW